MRRLKRNKPDRAFTRGYQAGIQGKSRDGCPYHSEESRHSWLTGWRQGREDNWDGLTGTAGVAFNPLG